MTATPLECTVFERISPCPELAAAEIPAFLLPWGEGQDEGRFPPYNQQPNDCHKTILRVPA